MTHAQLVQKAVAWLRAYRCGVILSEQACLSGEMPDAIGWKRACHSVLVECKISHADFLADRDNYLARFDLAADERAALAALDRDALREHFAINPMLLYQLEVRVKS